MPERYPARPWLGPPYRQTPESVRRIMATTLAALTLPVALGTAFFGFRAAQVVLLALAAAWTAESLATALRSYRPPGSTAHSLIVAVILAMTLPPTAPWYVVIVGVTVAVLAGKHAFGGLGHYIWHPALLGRIVVQLLFAPLLTGDAGPLLARTSLFIGDVRGPLQAASWTHFDWFRQVEAPDAAYLLETPLAALRSLGAAAAPADWARLLAERLPALDHVVVGAVPGGLGATSALALLLVGLFFCYRGYLRWQTAATFLAGVFVAALWLPLPNASGGLGGPPLLATSPAVAMTYANYHLFSGGVFLAAFIIGVDSTCRPLTLRGQMLTAGLGGVLTVLLRLYTPISIPVYAALLIMNTFTAPVDRLTRPRR